MKINLHINDLPESLVLKGDLAIDTEAMGLNLMRDRLCLVQICDESGAIHLVQFNKTANGNFDFSAPNLKKYLLDSKVAKIFHYARFDLAILMHYLKIDKIPNIFCTKIASKLSRTYTEYHGLKTIANELLGVELKKEQQSSNWSDENLSFEQKKYAANDVVHLHKLREKLLMMLEENGRRNMAFEYFSALHTICKADILGFNGSDILNH